MRLGKCTIFTIFQRNLKETEILITPALYVSRDLPHYVIGISWLKGYFEICLSIS